MAITASLMVGLLTLLGGGGDGSGTDESCEAIIAINATTDIGEEGILGARLDGISEKMDISKMAEDVFVFKQEIGAYELDNKVLLLEEETHSNYKQLSQELKRLVCFIESSEDKILQNKFLHSINSYKKEIDLLQVHLSRNRKYLEDPSAKIPLPLADSNLILKPIANHKGLIQTEKGGIETTDVIQGDLGDCFVLAPLMAIAKHAPEEIKKRMQSYADSIFEVNLYVHKNGQKDSFTQQKVVVNNEFVHQNNRLKYAKKTNDGELWVMVGEKAIAKILGGYDQIHKGGNPSLVLELLTGYPTEEISTQKPATEIMAILHKLFIDNRIAVVGSKPIAMIPPHYAITNYEQNGTIQSIITLPNGDIIYCPHVYVLDKVTKNSIRLLNPHGKGHLSLSPEVFIDCFQSIKVSLYQPALDVLP
jgi:hypothetical protein